MRLLEVIKRIKATHVIAVLLFLIWVELGGLGSVGSVAHDLVYAVKHIGDTEEGPAPPTEEQIKWRDEFDKARYGPAETAPSSP